MYYEIDRPVLLDNLFYTKGKRESKFERETGDIRFLTCFYHVISHLCSHSEKEETRGRLKKNPYNIMFAICFEHVIALIFFFQS